MLKYDSLQNDLLTLLPSSYSTGDFVEIEDFESYKTNRYACCQLPSASLVNFDSKHAEQEQTLTIRLHVIMQNISNYNSEVSTVIDEVLNSFVYENADVKTFLGTHNIYNLSINNIGTLNAVLSKDRRELVVFEINITKGET